MTDDGPIVTSAKTADVMNAVIQLRLDLVERQTRTDTLLESVMKTQDKQGEKLDAISQTLAKQDASFSTMEAKLNEQGRKVEDQESRLRMTEDRMDAIQMNKEALIRLEKGLEKETAARLVWQKEQEDKRQKDHDDLVRLYAVGLTVVFIGEIVLGLGVGLGWF